MLFDSTVRRELSRSFAATLVVILTIVLTMMLIRTLGQAANGQVAPQDVVLLLGYLALGQTPIVLALSLFVAIVVTLGRMYRESEMVVWFASGVGLARFVVPVLRTSGPVLAVIATVVIVVWPWGYRNMLELRQRYQQRSDLLRVAPGVFQTSANGKRVFFVESAGDDTSLIGRNVFVLDEEDRRESVTAAQSGRLAMEGDRQLLILERGTRQETDLQNGDHARTRFDEYRVVVAERPDKPDANPPPRALTTAALLAQSTPANQGEIAWRFGLALGAVNLQLLGIGLSTANPKRATSWNLLFALLAFVIYYNLLNLSQAWVAAGRLGATSALVGLHGGGLGVALALIWWRDRATSVLASVAHRRSAPR